MSPAKREPSRTSVHTSVHRSSRAFALVAMTFALAGMLACGDQAGEGARAATSAKSKGHLQGKGKAKDHDGRHEDGENGKGDGDKPYTVAHGDMKRASLGRGADLHGALPFPADNAWNTDISQSPVDPESDQIIAKIGANTSLHPDFGAGLYDGAPIGIPYVVVSGTQPKVRVHWTDYGNESDPGPYPIPPDAPIEGGPHGKGDRHVIVVDRDNHRLYELDGAYPNGDGTWKAISGAIFHTDSNDVRPTAQPRWTSADAAGLPVFPGLARYEEAARGPGGIRHALRFTVASSRAAYVPPATHWAPVDPARYSPPMGMRVRLKASYEIPAHFSKETRAILTAMKTYGMIVADNGSNWYVSGAPDERWDNDKLVSELVQVKGRHFEVVRMDGMVSR